MNSITHTQGDTLAFDALYAGSDELPVDLTGYTVEAQVRRLPDRELVDDLTVTVAADQTEDGDRGEFTLEATAAQTAEWPVGLLVCDVKFELAGVVTHGPTFGINVIHGVTE